MKSLPNLLSLTGAVDPSHASFFGSTDKKNKEPLAIKKMSILGTLGSHRQIEEIESGGINDSSGNVNIQILDSCFLEGEQRYLHVTGSIKVANMIDRATSNSPEDLLKIKDFYTNAESEISEISRRMVVKLFNGSVLHRNRYSKEIGLKLSINDNPCQSIIPVNVHADFSTNFGEHQGVFEELSEKFKDALLGSIEDILHIDYEFIVDAGIAQEVYPSQEFIESKPEKSESKKSKQGKVLFKMNDKNHTGLHTQKIGNALRTIDTWYSDESVSPIPVDPYGPDKANSTICRSKNHIFKMLTSLINDKALDSNESHYLAASLIRGGVYSGSKKDK